MLEKNRRLAVEPHFVTGCGVVRTFVSKTTIKAFRTKEGLANLERNICASSMACKFDTEDIDNVQK